MSIYITGDTHGDIDIGKLSFENWPESRTLTRDDYLIICGDFGLPFLLSDTWEKNVFIPNKHARSCRESYKHWIKWLSERPYTILWVDGNHDNHPYWYQQPVIMWNGGMVNIHPDAPNVIHLKRGEYYTIDGKTFWTMGGAFSHDKNWRVEGYTWWPEEIPSFDEMNHGLDILEQHDNKVDYIITHTMPQKLLGSVLGVEYDPEPTRTYFDEVYQRTQFKYWSCGHFHQDSFDEDSKVYVLYNKILALESLDA